MIICLVFVALTDAPFYCYVKMQILQVSNCQSRGYIMAVNTNEHELIHYQREHYLCNGWGQIWGLFQLPNRDGGTICTITPL